MKKKIISILLAAVMVVTMLPATLVAVFAEASAPIITKVDSAVLDGNNTNGEYDSATKVMLNSYGNDTDGDNMRIVYTDEAIYVLVEVFDSTVVNYSDYLSDGTTKAGSSKCDFAFLGFSIGESFQGVKRVYRGGAGRTTFQPDGVYVDVTTGYGSSGVLEDKYYAHTNSEENGFTLEARFPVSEMSANDQAYYAAGQLEIRFTAGTQDSENKGTEFAITYDGDTANRGWDGAADSDYFVPSNNTSYKAKNPSAYPEYAFEFVSDGDVVVTPSNVIPYTESVDFDGANTNGEYDNAYSVPFTTGMWGAAPTGKESLKVMYSDDAIYVLLESADTTDNAANDYLVFTFAIGTSYVASQIAYRTDAYQYTNQGGTVSMSSTWSLSATYFKKTVTANGIAFEAKFPVDNMNDADKAAFANGTLSVKLAAMVNDNWTITETVSGVYSNRTSDTTNVASGAEAIAMGVKPVVLPKSNYMTYAANANLDGVNTSGEYDSTYTIPFNVRLWSDPKGNETMKAIYSDDAIYLLIEIVDTVATSDDFVGLNFRVGSSYVGYLQFNRLNSSVNSAYSNAGEVEMKKAWLRRVDTATGWTVEIMFPVASMTDDDKATFAAGELDVGFSACYLDAWGGGKNGSTRTDANATYSLSATAYTNAPALAFYDKSASVDYSVSIPYNRDMTLDGVDTNNEYANACTMVYSAGMWGYTPTGNETLKVVYSDTAIYVLVTIYDSEESATSDEYHRLHIRIGESFIGTKLSNKLQTLNEEYNNAGGKVNLSGEQNKLFRESYDGSCFTIEAEFPVSLMTAADQAAFANRTLDIAFGGAYNNNWSVSMTSASLTYDNASADMLAGMTPLNLGEHIVKSEFLGAYIALGSDITVYYVARTTPDATVKFIMNGKETVVNGVATGNLDEYKFAFRGIAPQCIGDDIIAKLTVGDEVVETHSGYSVRANCIALLGEIDESNVTPLQALVCDLLEYGAAAQIYAGYKTDRLVNSGYENIGYTGWVIPDENEDKTVSDPLADAKFTAAGVYHGNTNKIYAKFWAEDVSAVTAKIDGEDAVVEQYVDGSYIVYTDDILVTDFDRVYTITITTASGTQTITYSVDAWCKAKYESENTATAALALALYAYGYSADQYIAYN